MTQILTCRAVLFDLDGVLVDSARVVAQTWHTGQRVMGSRSLQDWLGVSA